MTNPRLHHGSDHFDDLYASRPPWDIGRPQPAIAALAESGALRGRVLDIGCGTGEQTLLAAALGLDATGVDWAASALRAAEAKARDRGLAVRFLRQDVMRLAELNEVFDTALDVLVMHAFTAADRAAYLEQVHAVLRPGGRFFVLCYADRQAPDVTVPHAMSRPDVESCFAADGWRLSSVRPAVSESTVYADGVAAWLVAVIRV